MIAELGDLALDAQPPEGVRLLPVTDRAGVDLVADVHEQAFRTDSTRMRHQLLAQLTGDEDNVVAVVALALVTSRLSAARMEMVPGTRFAGLPGGGTIDSWRRRGIDRALVAHRACVAAERGYRYVQVDADQSEAGLARLGFEP